MEKSSIIMDFKTQTTGQMHPQGNRKDSGSTSKLVAMVVSVVVVILLVIACMLLWQSKASNSDTTSVDKNKFQAVFLTNGQVYFGHLASLKGEYIELTDIYYLQVQQSVQPSTDNKQQEQTADDSKVSLTKLGSELHGPTDKMNIAKDQVLFWEDLKDDSSVVKAIKEHQAKN